VEAVQPKNQDKYFEEELGKRHRLCDDQYAMEHARVRDQLEDIILTVLYEHCKQDTWRAFMHKNKYEKLLNNPYGPHAQAAVIDSLKGKHLDSFKAHRGQGMWPEEHRNNLFFKMLKLGSFPELQLESYKEFRRKWGYENLEKNIEQYAGEEAFKRVQQDAGTVKREKAGLEVIADYRQGQVVITINGTTDFEQLKEYLGHAKPERKLKYEWCDWEFRLEAQNLRGIDLDKLKAEAFAEVAEWHLERLIQHYNNDSEEISGFAREIRLQLLDYYHDHPSEKPVGFSWNFRDRAGHINVRSAEEGVYVEAAYKIEPQTTMIYSHLMGE